MILRSLWSWWSLVDLFVLGWIYWLGGRSQYRRGWLKGRAALRREQAEERASGVIQLPPMRVATPIRIAPAHAPHLTSVRPGRPLFDQEAEA